MDHHQHHLHGHSSRYPSLPPRPPPSAPIFLDPDPYRRPSHIALPPQPPSVSLPRPPVTHHHRRPDDGAVVYLSYAASSITHASGHGGRFLAPADPPDRLVFEPSHPHVPSIRVSDRIIFPDGHPDARRVPHHQRRSADEVFVREDVKRERIRVFDEGQVGIQYGRREGVVVELGEPEDAARRLPLLGRRRPRWEEDRALGRDTLLECLEGREPKRLSSGATTGHRRCDAFYDPRAGGAESSRGSSCVFASERGESVLAFPRLPEEVPLRSPGYSVSNLQLLEKSRIVESETLALGSSHGSREKHFTSRGKRSIFVREEEVDTLPEKELRQKPSVLSRIQFAKPVWKSKHEQHIISTASPLPVPQPLACDRLEMDRPVELDVSFKSDVLVAKDRLISPVSALRRTIGQVRGARTTKKIMTKDTTVSPSTSFPKSDKKVAAMRTHKAKTIEGIFAHLSPDGKPNKVRTPMNRVANKVLVSSKSVMQNFDDEATGSRTPRIKVANEVSMSPNPAWNSTDKISLARTAEDKMAEKILAQTDAGVLNNEGKVNFTRSPIGTPAKEILVPQSNAISNPNDRLPTLKTLEKPGSDGIITSERCPEGRLARVILDNSTDAGPNIGGTVNSDGSTGKKLEKETLIPQMAASLHCNDKVTTTKDPNKEVREKISFPSVPLSLNAEENTILDKPEKKPGKDTFNSPISVVNSNKKVTTMRTLKKRVIKRNNKNKVGTFVSPCLPILDVSVEFCKGRVSTNLSPEEIGPGPSKESQLASLLTSSHMEQKYMEEGKKDVKHSEIAQKLSTSNSSSEDLKHLEDMHAKFVSGYSEMMASTTGRSLRKKVIKKKKEGETTLFPRALVACLTQEICETPLLKSSHEDPMHSEEVQQESLSNCLEKDANCSEGAHKDALDNDLQCRVDAAEVQSGSVLASSCEDVEHLGNVHGGSRQTTASVDADFRGKGQEQLILTCPHNDLVHPVLLGTAEVPGKLGVDNSALGLHSQEIMLLGHLETNTEEAPTSAVVSREVDMNGSPSKKSSLESTVENIRSSVQQEDSSREGDANPGEGSGCGKVLSASKGISVSDVTLDEKVPDQLVVFDENSSLKADITGGKEEGEQTLSAIPQTGAVLDEFEVASCEKDATTVLHYYMQERSVPLHLEVQTSVPELEEERKQQLSPAQRVIVTAKELGNVCSEDNIVGGEGSRKLHADVPPLPFEAQDAVLDRHLLMGTNGQDDSVLHSPFMAVFPQSVSSVINLEFPVVNSLAEQVADRADSSALSVSKKNPPRDLAIASKELHLAEVKQTVCDLLDNESYHDPGVGKLHEDNSKDDSLFGSKPLSMSESKISGKSDLINLSDYLISGKTLPPLTQEAQKQLNRSHQVTGKGKLTNTMICQRPGISKMHPSQTSLSARSFKKPSSHSIRRNTWHRTDNPPVSSSTGHTKWLNGGFLSKQSPKKLGKIQSSYIRKGNSLIRKSSSVNPSANPYSEQNALDQAHGPETGKNISTGDKIDVSDRSSFYNVRTLIGSFERPKTPPLTLSAKPTHPSLNSCQTLIEDPLSEPGGEDHATPSVETPCSDLSEESHINIMSEKSKVSDKMRVVYVKHRSNQLIASPGSDANNAIHTSEETPLLHFAPRDIYYRNKNKLIRDTSSSDGEFKQEISLPNDHPDAKFHGSHKMSSLKGGAKVPRKMRLEKAMQKTYKQSRFSLVWTLNGTQSQNTNGSHVLKHPKVLPYLFPWKRTMYRRNIFTKMGSNSNRHGSSLISKKLQLSRQRDTIYTLSNSGFSLRKSVVLSVDGSNLKWSKSMERRSRKASEEATLAIVEHERRKRKQKGTTSADLTTKGGNSSQRERIFRVGAIRYKMDPSRRTLVRIPDEQTPAVINSKSVRGAKMSIVPRRLLIGNDEYIRVGNGNQLVRDPKKLVRILANEKIRWSLHTARLRSVRKQQYCQFFTRFGKCNKEDGKCPYIHDPTKVAICTKFLKGLCSSPSCNLTHKVIPERMPDCSYFLQGMCTNTTCPYRHVNVNPKASVCEGFLKGYCRDGDECRKKHSYVCPHFETSGKCPQGSACKLHHPKHANKQANKSRKRKRTTIHNHGRGRYFGCSASEVGEPQMFASNMDMQKKHDIFFHEGRFAEYISLDIDTDGDVIEDNDPMNSHSILMNSNLSDSQSSDADALIKPVRIMNMDPR